MLVKSEDYIQQPRILVLFLSQLNQKNIEKITKKSRKQSENFEDHNGLIKAQHEASATITHHFAFISIQLNLEIKIEILGVLALKRRLHRDLNRIYEHVLCQMYRVYIAPQNTLISVFPCNYSLSWKGPHGAITTHREREGGEGGRFSGRERERERFSGRERERWLRDLSKCMYTESLREKLKGTGY